MTILTLPYFILVTYIGYYMNTGTGVILYDYVNIKSAALPLLKEILKKNVETKAAQYGTQSKVQPAYAVSVGSVAPNQEANFLTAILFAAGTVCLGSGGGYSGFGGGGSGLMFILK